jgi:SAM-dependent methyltransferase
MIPPWALRRLRDYRSRIHADPPVGGVDFGDLVRPAPIDGSFGYARGGTLIDRFYIERFLVGHASDIRGRVLEVADDAYTRRFGGKNVHRSDVLGLNVSDGISVVADLCSPPKDLPWEAFDCIVFTQTLQFVSDPAAAICTLARLLHTGGVLLATFPGISQISRYDADRWGDRWRFTTLSARELFEGAFGDVLVEGFGSVLTAIGLLHGLVVEDLPRGSIDRRDPDFELLVTVRAVKR